TLEAAVISGKQIVDLRPGFDFAAGFVPGVVSIPLNKSFLNYAGALLDAKEELCLIGLEPQVCEATAALALIGLDRVTGWFAPAALDHWRGKHGRLAAIHQVDLPQLLERRENGDVVLDVRAATEFRAGHIPGAIHIPLGRVLEAADKLARRSAIVVHCQGGGRSPIALSVLRRMGFEQLANYAGGFADYQRRGQPVETGGV